MAVQKKMQSPVSPITVPQFIPQSVTDVVDKDKFNPLLGMVDPVLLPDAGTWGTKDVSVKPEETAPTAQSPLPRNLFGQNAFHPQAWDNYVAAMKAYEGSKLPYKDYSSVSSPEWTFNDPPPEMRRQNVDRVNPAATDIALAMMGLGGLMGNSDYAIQAGTNFLGKANAGAHQADMQDFQSRAGLYDDQLKAAGVRYQRDIDRSNQQMRSIDATNAITQRDNDSRLDNILRQYQVDQQGDTAKEKQLNDDKMNQARVMAQLVNSGRFMSGDGASLNALRDFLQGGEGDPLMQYFYAGVSPDKQAQLEFAKADLAQRKTLAERAFADKMAIVTKTLAAQERMATQRDTGANARTASITANRLAVQRLANTAKTAGLSNDAYEQAVRFSQNNLNQINMNMRQAEREVDNATRQLAAIRGNKNFFNANSPDGLNDAGRKAIESATQAINAAEEKLTGWQQAYQQANIDFVAAYNGYLGYLQQAQDGSPMPPMTGVQAPRPLTDADYANAASGALESVWGGGGAQPGQAQRPPSRQMPTLPGQPPPAPSAKNGWKGLTKSQYFGLSDADKRKVPTDILKSVFRG